MTRALVTLVAALLFLAPASGQTTGAPQGFSFQKSPSQGDTSVFTGYRAEVRQSATVVKQQNIGAPTPDASGTVTYTNPSFFPTADGDYVLYVFAYGPGGDSQPATAPFTISSGTITTPASPSNITFVACNCGPGPTISDEVVLYGLDATAVVGNRWSLVSDSTAAGGHALYLSNTNTSKLPNASAAPASYVEFQFTVKAGVAYHVWTRMKADSNSYTNDSLFAQFSGSVDSNGQPTARIGTTAALILYLDGGSTEPALSGWGWNDNGYGTLGSNVYFAVDGLQTLRVQQREDGMRLDQVVISPSKYLTARPGALTNDATIVAKP